MRTLNIYPPSKFQVYNTVLLIITHYCTLVGDPGSQRSAHVCGAHFHLPSASGMPGFESGLISCALLDQSLSLSVPQFFHVQNEDNNDYAHSVGHCGDRKGKCV